MRTCIGASQYSMCACNTKLQLSFRPLLLLLPGAVLALHVHQQARLADADRDAAHTAQLRLGLGARQLPRRRGCRHAAAAVQLLVQRYQLRHKAGVGARGGAHGPARACSSGAAAGRRPCFKRVQRGTRGQVQACTCMQSHSMLGNRHT